jgi:hypothetical protein
MYQHIARDAGACVPAVYRQWRAFDPQRMRAPAKVHGVSSTIGGWRPGLGR